MLLFLFAHCIAFGALAQDVTHASLPTVFRHSIPSRLDGGLMLVELMNRCDGCSPWRTIDFGSNASAEPIRQETVSVAAGYRAMYAFPGTHYFANTKIEQSAPKRFDIDRQIMEDAIRHEYQRKKALVESYLSTHPEVRLRVDAKRPKDRDNIEFEEGYRNGIRYVSYVENVIGLTGSTISQIHFFVPATSITVTAYLLQQKKTKFATIEEFRLLREQFIDGYTAYLAAPH